MQCCSSLVFSRISYDMYWRKSSRKVSMQRVRAAMSSRFWCYAKIKHVNSWHKEKAKRLITSHLAFLLVTPVGLEPTTH